eukprot:3221233-Pleurochrysis_carterae.AAC.2
MDAASFELSIAIGFLVVANAALGRLYVAEEQNTLFSTNMHLWAWLVSGVFWMPLALMYCKKRSIHSPFSTIALVWPILIACCEMYAETRNDPSFSRRTSVQMDMNALINISLALGTVFYISNVDEKEVQAEACGSTAKIVLALCICFLLPSPCINEVIIIQRIATSYATGLLLLTASRIEL